MAIGGQGAERGEGPGQPRSAELMNANRCVEIPDAVVAHGHEPEPVVDGEMSSDVVGEQYLATVRASHHA